MKFGWIRDLPDMRDKLFMLPALAELPPKFAMAPPFVYDQGDLGSCTANAVLACYQMTNLEQRPQVSTPSRLALYYWTRSDQGTVSYDSGASLRGTIKAAAGHGVCRDESWPYDTSKYKMKPSIRARAEEAQHKLAGRAYARVPQELNALKATLAANNPVAFGFTVYESFMSHQVATTGVAPMPAWGERVLGGHAVTLIGYDDAQPWGDGKAGAFLVKNSWGERWGLRGNVWMPYPFVCGDDSSDFWTIYNVPDL